MIKLKILFIGCVEFSRILLEKLISLNEDIVGVITKRQSNFNSDFYDLSEVCVKNNIDYKYVVNINDIENIEYISDKKPDVIYCFGWSQIIGKEIIRIPSKGIIGFHPAELPNNRGRHPIIWALVLGLEKTASTFFFIDEGTDTGKILSQETVDISYSDDAKILYDKIVNAAVKQIDDITNQLKNGNIYCIEQNHDTGNFWRKRSRADGKIDWRMSSTNIYNLVRALTKPYSGANFEYNDKEYKVWKVEELKGLNLKNIEPGKVLEVYSKNSFLVKVGDEAIRVLKCDEISIEVGDYL